MLIDHFSSFPHGGAGTAARRLHERLLERGISSRFNFWKDQTAQRLDSSYRKTEFAAPKSALIPGPLARKLRRNRARTVCNLYDRHLSNRPDNFELFSIPWVTEPTNLDWSQFESDVVHLHWMAFYIDYPSFFKSIPRRVPIVWSFHDMNPLTGGCHYNSGCDRFRDGCGNCPQIENPGPNDVSAIGFRDKQKALRGRQVLVLTPNEWLSDLAKSSPIFPANTQYHVIRLGLNENTFRPIDRKLARAKLGLNPDAIMLAFGAEDIGNYRKGFHHLLGALQTISTKTEIECIVFGSGKIPEDVEGLPKTHQFGFVDDEQRQALLYSAADMFVLPSREDNQPQTGLEAMACGVPVIAFRAGGIPEYVLHEQTGLIAELGDEKQLSDHICSLAVDSRKRSDLGNNARRMIEQEFTAELQARSYIDLYREILQSSSVSSARRAA